MKRMYFIAVSLIALALPWARGASTLPIICLGMVWLYDRNWKEKWHNIKTNYYSILPFLLYFLAHIIGLLYTSDTHTGWLDISKKLNLLFLPIILISIGSQLVDYKKYIGQIFVLSLLLFFGVALWKAYPNYKAGNELAFFYIHLVSFCNMHPSYVSMYALLGIVLAYDWAIRSSKKYLLLIPPLFIFIILLIARTEFLILFVLLISIWLFHFFVRKKYFIGFGGVAFILFISIVAVIKIPELNTRFSKVFEQKKETKNNWTITNVREKIWSIAWHRIKEKPIIGVGTGAGASILLNDFQREGDTLLAKNTNLNNVHNQFIQQWFLLGVIGLVTVLYLYIFLFWQAYRLQSFTLFIFALILTLASLTECILESQSGLVFLILFYGLLRLKDVENNRVDASSLIPKN